MARATSLLVDLVGVATKLFAGRMCRMYVGCVKLQIPVLSLNLSVCYSYYCRHVKRHKELQCTNNVASGRQRNAPYE